MDLRPVYELRARLRSAAIAGTDLLAEDYRLKRALEAMKPLEAASPVFAKIGMLVRKLLAPNCLDRVGFLMEAISLIDALLCTQASVAVAGDLKEFEPMPYKMKVYAIPYSVLQPLLQALTTPGGGHYSYVIDMHKEYPEIFEDYRVQAAMVEALGASYAELAEQVSRWLAKSGPEVVPLLKEGFDAKGGKEMFRRAVLLDEISGGMENAFYLQHIEDSEKTIRAVLIQALRHCKENREVLVNLTRTERGKCKQAAVAALEYLEKL